MFLSLQPADGRYLSAAFRDLEHGRCSVGQLVVLFLMLLLVYTVLLLARR